jgi:transaldolase
MTEPAVPQNALDALREMTVVVADTGDLDAVRRLQPQDCTTNPSLVLKAAGSDAFSETMAQVLTDNAGQSLPHLVDALTLELGVELASIVPGRVSTEVDARLSFDTKASILKARAIIDGYAARGIGRERVLIKLASTWEGIQAARQLQSDGIDCNLTLLFSMAQARACADAGAFLISPFVGRITDWYKESQGVESFTPDDDPGVASVQSIYAHYKECGISTVVMGASFRSVDQVLALAGCDRLTISPALLDEIASRPAPIARRLSAPTQVLARSDPIDEANFRWELNEDEMATEKLSQGIRAFHADTLKLEGLIQSRR